MRAKQAMYSWSGAIIILLVFVTSCEDSSTPANRQQIPPDRVAVVNGTVISRVALDSKIAGFKQSYMMTGQVLTDDELAKRRKQILGALIDRELLYQESQKSGIDVGEAAINTEVEKIKKQFQNEDAFKERLNAMNMSEDDLKAEMALGLAIQQFIDQKVTKDVKVSDEDTKTYYDNNLEAFKQPEQVRASHILIKVDPDATEEQKAEARKQLQDIQAKLANGDDFAALAKEFSQGPTGVNGGDLNYFGRGQMVKPFDDVAFALEPGKVSDIVETQFGYHIIKVVDKKDASTIAYDDIKGDMKDRLTAFLRQQKVQETIEGYVKTLRENAEIETFLQEDAL